MTQKYKFKKPADRQDDYFIDLLGEWARNTPFVYKSEEPVLCLHFGCGKTLSPRERLFGKLCINHQKPTSFPALIDPYL